MFGHSFRYYIVNICQLFLCSIQMWPFNIITSSCPVPKLKKSNICSMSHSSGEEKPCLSSMGSAGSCLSTSPWWTPSWPPWGWRREPVGMSSSRSSYCLVYSVNVNVRIHCYRHVLYVYMCTFISHGHSYLVIQFDYL